MRSKLYARRHLAALLVSVGLVPAACGSDDNSSSATDAPSATAGATKPAATRGDTTAETTPAATTAAGGTTAAGPATGEPYKVGGVGLLTTTTGFEPFPGL